MIDPDQVITALNYPQALREALIHRRNTMVGNIEVQDSKLQCACCSKRMRKSQPVDFDIEDIGFLGGGYPLYFLFNRMCLIILLTLSLLVSLNPFLYSKLKDTFGIEALVKQYELLTLEMLGCTMAIMYLVEQRMIRTVIELDETHVDPEDYSVSVRNLPIEFSEISRLDTSLKRYFETQYSQEIKISSISYCYNLVPLQRFLQRKKEHLNSVKRYRNQKEKIQKIMNVIFNTSQMPYERVSQYHGVKRDSSSDIEMGNFQEYSRDKLSSLDQFINFSYHNSNIMFIGEAILSFESVMMKMTVLKESENAYFFGNKLVVEEAPSPSNIIWDNLHLEESDYKVRKIFSYASCVTLIFTALSIKIFFAWLQLKTEGTRFQSSLLKSSTSGVIILMNMSIENFFLKHLSIYEGHRTKVKNLTMFTTKCIALQLLTCLIVPYLAAYFIFQMREQQTYLQKMDDLIFGNAIVSLSLLSISHKTILQTLKIKLFELGGWRFIPKQTLTVRELCQMYQFPEFEIERRYSQTIKNTFLTVCFFTMVPKALFYTIIHLAFTYYLDKYNLVRRRCVLININGQMNHTMMKIITLCIPFHIVAQMVHRREITWVMMGALVCSVIGLAMFSFKKRPEKSIDVADSMTFWEANSKYFHTDYRRQNPALAGVAQAQFQQRMKELNSQPLTGNSQKCCYKSYSL